PPHRAAALVPELLHDAVAAVVEALEVDHEHGVLAGGERDAALLVNGALVLERVGLARALVEGDGGGGGAAPGGSGLGVEAGGELVEGRVVGDGDAGAGLAVEVDAVGRVGAVVVVVVTASVGVFDGEGLTAFAHGAEDAVGDGLRVEGVVGVEVLPFEAAVVGVEGGEVGAGGDLEPWRGAGGAGG